MLFVIKMNLKHFDWIVGVLLDLMSSVVLLGQKDPTAQYDGANCHTILLSETSDLGCMTCGVKKWLGHNKNKQNTH